MFTLLSLDVLGFVAVALALAKVVAAAHDQCLASRTPQNPTAATMHHDFLPSVPAPVEKEEHLRSHGRMVPESEPFSWLEPPATVPVAEVACDRNAEPRAATPAQRPALRIPPACEATLQNIVILPALPTDLYADPIDGSPIHSGEDFILCLCGTGYHVETLAWLQECNAGACVQCNRTLDRKVYRVAFEEQEADLSMAS